MSSPWKQLADIPELTPDLVGPSTTRNQGIIGDAVDLDLSATRTMGMCAPSAMR